MLSRTVVGAVAGAVAGAGFLLTLTLLVRYCNGGPSRAGCSEFPLLTPPNYAFWMVVAGVLVAVGFRLVQQERGWWVMAVGSGLWVVLILAVLYAIYEYLDLFQAERGPYFVTATVIVPCVAYAIAALCTGRPRRW